MISLILRNVEVGGIVTDVRLRNAIVDEVGSVLLGEPGVEEIDGEGGALIPGLHDHHLHLLATAAAEQSVQLGPPNVLDRDQFTHALREASRSLASDTWVRGVGYHESVAGDLDRRILDDVVPDRPVRIQHSSGAAWFLNSRALSAIGAEGSDGRMFRQDEWLRLRRPASDPPDLGHLSDRLASFGVTGVTDATPSDDLSSVQILGQAVIDGTFAQEITVMGSTCLAHAPWVDGVRWGPVKFIIGDHELPTFDEICDACRLAHANGRTFAVHCVTPVALALAVAAWEETGVLPGDRIEHGSVIVPDAAERLAELGLEVVTQPGLIASRGDGYQRDVEANLLPFLYPCASLVARGVKVGGSTDAPYGELDPWKAIAAAMSRRTASGEVLNPAERLEPERALELFLTTPEDPGGSPRKIAVGAGANVCLLDAPLAAVMEETSSEHVVATIIGGRVVYHR